MKISRVLSLCAISATIVFGENTLDILQNSFVFHSKTTVKVD